MANHCDFRKRCSFGERIDFGKKFENLVSIENINIFIDFGNYEHVHKHNIENNVNCCSFLENYCIKNVSLYLDDILIQTLDKDFIFIWNELATEPMLNELPKICRRFASFSPKFDAFKCVCIKINFLILNYIRGLF